MSFIDRYFLSSAALYSEPNAVKFSFLQILLANVKIQISHVAVHQLIVILRNRCHLEEQDPIGGGVVVTNILHHRRGCRRRTANHLAIDLTTNHIILMTDTIYDLNRSDPLVVVLIRGDFGAGGLRSASLLLRVGRLF